MDAFAIYLAWLSNNGHWVHRNSHLDDFLDNLCRLVVDLPNNVKRVSTMTNCLYLFHYLSSWHNSLSWQTSRALVSPHKVRCSQIQPIANTMLYWGYGIGAAIEMIRGALTLHSYTSHLAVSFRSSNVYVRIQNCVALDNASLSMRWWY